jgi:uncharacterized protein
MQRTILATLALLSLPIVLLAQQRTETSEAPMLRVTGTGTSSANPDLLRMNVAVITRDSIATGAASENARVVTNVLAALRAQLPPGSAITTLWYGLEPQYEYPAEGGEPRFRGFAARNVLRVETADLNKAGAIIDAAIGSGANSVTEVTYSLRNESKLKAEALAAAARDARAKAEALASATGVRLGAARTIDESARVMPLPYAANLAPGGSGGTPVISGPVEVQATVVITYDIAR